jgi:nucleotide-binding universal stress UspA family protein
MASIAIRRILVPVDFSSCSRAALEFAQTLGASLGASLEVLYVSPESDDGVRRAAEAELHGFVGKAAQGSSVPAKERVLTGDPRERIVTTAETEGFDLIVLGTHGRTGRTRSLAGSVAESVVRTSARPVVTVREAI